MHEGKNIHFSPVDNKPLCSYSNKLCRQRRLNGYAFCIRHILEDKSAPFKQCSFVTRNNCQKCLNAIPTNQERGYCHSHMQVIGIIPKTERKTKSSSTLPTQTGKTMLKRAYSSNTSSCIDLCNSTPETATVSKEGIYDYDDDSLPSPPALLLKGKIGSNSICHDKVATASRENIMVSLKEKKAAADSNIVSKNDKSDSKGAVNNSSNWKVNKNKHSSNIISEEKSATITARMPSKSRETSKPILTSNTETKPVLKSKLTIPVKIPSCAVAEPQLGITNGSLVRDTWRTFKFSNISLEEEDKLKPLHQYEQMKTLKTLRKLPLFIDGPLSVNSPPSQSTQNQVNSSSSVSSTLRIPISKSSFSNDFKTSIKRSAALEILMTPPFLNLSVNNKCAQKLPDGLSDGEEDSKSYDLCTSGENSLSIDGIAIRNRESRQQFLCRVRKAFKSQYRTIKRACKISEKHEKRDKRAFRNSLLTCVMNNPGFCAQVLVQGNNESNCKNTTTSSNEFTITNLTNHIRNGSTQKLIINELKSGSTKINSASLSKSNKRDKNKNLPNLDIKSDAESKPIVKLIDIDNKASDKADNSNFKSVLKTEGKKYKPADIGCNLPLVDPSKVKKKQRFRGHVSASTISRDDIESTNASDTSADCLRWDILDGFSTVKCSSSTKIMTSSSLLSGILKNGPLTANLRKRKNDNESMEPHNIGYDSAPVVIKTEVVESWNSEGTGLNTSSNISNHSEIIVNNPNGDINNFIKDRNDVLENCSVSKQSKNELQARLLQMQMNHNQLISCVNPKVGPESSSSLDTVDTSKNITADTSVDSPFDQSSSSHRDGHDCHFTDEDVDQNLELQLDPEIAQQASRLLEDNELTEDDFNELFPETRLGDQKLNRTDLSDLGIDFASNIDTNDVDYSLFANIFPNVTRSIQHSSIFVNNQF